MTTNRNKDVPSKNRLRKNDGTLQIRKIYKRYPKRIRPMEYAKLKMI